MADSTFVINPKAEYPGALNLASPLCLEMEEINRAK